MNRAAPRDPDFRRAPACLLAALACLGAAVADVTPALETLPSLERVYVNPEPMPIADFVLTDHNGKKRSFASLRGQPVLVFFGFTHCPDLCPAALSQLKALHAAQGGALQAARVVMISVDGERDSPAALKAFLAPLSPDFVGLTGDPQITAAIAAHFSAVFFKEPPGKDGNYNVAHSAQIFVVDKRGRLRASFVNASVENMAKITALLIKEPG
jgi:cytochrome oxidase Cu insertion factor (SCO1/SenC/PrrC family)